MNHVLIHWTSFNIRRDNRGRRGGKRYRAVKYCGHIGAPEENRTGDHCHKIVNCSGNKKIMTTVM
jgi:hypothetical protein